MQIASMDHLVLTVKSIKKTVHFYRDVLGMKMIRFKKGNTERYGLKYGQMKFNLHETDNEFEPKAKLPTPGSEDFCLISKTPIDDVIKELNDKNIPIEDGPMINPGAMGKIKSIYLRDPDDNLVEIANYLK
ncbi:virulence protein [Philodulcilactobacillus myokoensis]|uniref:Virulence protein n=1 Tax=Philodulcilactobacillus myokoensis TaxID=2929573 RepID=A0A9W6B3D3_9LACO|nr:VOC family protein [Philodulcilactobacillus myokoensis]GLB47566.1 virulence protein [Philodulcilactobacillus myokoensis]